MFLRRHQRWWFVLVQTLVCLSFVISTALADGEVSKLSSPIDPENPQLSAEQLYDYFFSYPPPASGSVYFFSLLNRNPQLRAYYNDLIEHSEKLKAKAKEGRLFRERMIDLIRNTFDRNPDTLLLATNPYVWIDQSFKRFFVIKKDRNEVPIPELLAEAQSKDFTSKTYEELARDNGYSSFSQILSNDSDAKVFQSRAFNRRQQSTEQRSTQTEEDEKEALVQWKNETILRIRQVRARNFIEMLKMFSRVFQIEVDFRNSVYPDEFQISGVRLTAIRPEVARQMDRNAITYNKQRLWPRPYVPPEAKPPLTYRLEDPRAQELILQDFEYRWGSPFRNDWNSLHPFNKARDYDRERHLDHGLEDYIDLDSLNQRHSEMNSQVFKQSIRQAWTRNQLLIEAERLLEYVPDRKRETKYAFLKRLKERLKPDFRGISQWDSLIHSRSFDEALNRRGGISKYQSDHVEDLLWFGFAQYDGADHWSQRDSSEHDYKWPISFTKWIEKLNLEANPDRKSVKSAEAASEKPRFSLRPLIPNLNIKSGLKKIAIAAVFGGVAVALSTFLPARSAPIGAGILPTWGSGSNELSMGREEHSLSDSDSEKMRSKEPLYELRSSSSDLPTYFDIQLDSSRVPMLNQLEPVNLYDTHRDSDLEILSKVPNRPDRAGYMALPNPRGMKIVGLQIKTLSGETLDPSVYELYRDPVRNFLYLELFRADQPITFSASFAADPEVAKVRKSRFDHFEIARLKPIAEELREGGETEIAKALEESFRHQESEGVISADELTNDFAKSSRWSEVHEAADPLPGTTGPYADFSKWVRDGKCYGICRFYNMGIGNLVLGEYFALDFNVDVENRSTFVRPPNAKVLTRADYHVQEELRTRDNSDQAILDFTPSEKEDPKTTVAPKPLPQKSKPQLMSGFILLPPAKRYEDPKDSEQIIKAQNETLIPRINKSNDKTAAGAKKLNEISKSDEAPAAAIRKVVLPEPAAEVMVMEPGISEAEHLARLKRIEEFKERIFGLKEPKNPETGKPKFNLAKAAVETDPRKDFPIAKFFELLGKLKEYSKTGDFPELAREMRRLYSVRIESPTQLPAALIGIKNQEVDRLRIVQRKMSDGEARDRPLIRKPGYVATFEEAFRFAIGTDWTPVRRERKLASVGSAESCRAALRFETSVAIPGWGNAP